MSLFKITRSDLENFTVVANPSRTFESSSSGLTGSVNLFARRSPSEKETQPLSPFTNIFFVDESLNEVLERAKKSGREDGNNNLAISNYLDLVNARVASARRAQTLDVERFVPSFTFTGNSISKTQIIDTLMPYYRTRYPQAHFAYTNYHCLNFFTASDLPETSAVIYANTSSGSISSPYTLDGAFTFDFWINPRYTAEDNEVGFKAGTIYHLSSSYAVSMVSGSSVDSEGLPDAFRLLLQLSHSAGETPSEAVCGAAPPYDLIFSSSDNVLKRNNWHHVVIRWGTNAINEGSGSFVVDGSEAGFFVVPSASIAHVGAGTPSTLIIGNFYEGSNSGNAAQAIFFAADPAARDGIPKLSSVTSIDQPDPLVMDHPLNAELHDLKIYSNFKVDSQIVTTAPRVNELGLRFYVPPFFTKESPVRKFVGTFGGVLQTPFFPIDGFTDDPFNVAMSFGVGGHYLNNENFGRDFITGNYPRWFDLSSSQIQGNAQEALTANAYLYATGSAKKRNLSILPCDNGLFTPNFSWLATGSNQASAQIPRSGSLLNKYVNDLGSLDLSFISLRNMVLSSSIRQSLTTESGSLFENIVGATPEDPGVNPGDVLTILQRTRDTSSNEVVYFDMSNIFYGERINPGSFQIKDSSLTGSHGKVSITLKDDGYGSLYRADALTTLAKWNSVGNIFYHEGILMVKSPNIPLFGEDQWETSFEGEHSVHVLKFDIVAGAGLVDSSSNPSYIEVSASFDANDKDSKFVYISNILYLDDNLNVVMKTNLSQPVVKRRSEKITFRPKIDF